MSERQKLLGNEYETAQDAEIISPSFENYENTQTQAQEKVQEFIDTLNNTSDGDVLLVKRQITDGKSPMEDVAEFPADKYTYGELVHYLRTEYGGGQYRVYIMAKGRIRANKLLSIAKPLNNVQKNTENKGMENIVSRLMEQMQEMQNMLIRMGQQNNQPQQTEEDWYRKLIMMKEIFSNNNSNQNQQSPLERVKETLEIFDLAGIDVNKAVEDKEPGFGQIWEKTLPLLDKALSQQPQPTVQPHIKTNPEQRESQKMIEIKNTLKQMLKAAIAGSDPGIYAQLLVDQFGPQFIARILDSPTEAQKLISLEPRLQMHMEWIMEVFEHIKAIMGRESKYSGEYDNSATFDNEYNPEENNSENLTESQSEDITATNDNAAL